MSRSRIKIQIIVLFQNLGDRQAYYAKSPAPPLSGIVVAGLTPPSVDVEVLHEMVRPIDYSTDADVIALSFMDFCFPHACEVSARFRKLGKTVIAGGRYATTFPERLLPHFDCVVAGEAHAIWPQVVDDLVRGRLQKFYRAPFGPPLTRIPPARYDLVEPAYAVPVVTEATRGCPHRCSFCHLTVEGAPFRRRPIGDVIRDLTATGKLPLHKRRMGMIYDNNFGGDMKYAKELLREIARLDYWGLGYQFSFDCLHDDEFVDLLQKAHCTMAFIGLESLNEPSLRSVHKRHNKVEEYRDLFRKLRERGILTFTGMILALDEDTEEYYGRLPQRIDEVDPSTILLSIAIPIPGTPFHKEVEAQGRIVDHDLSHYEGDHLVIKPRQVSANDIFRTFVKLNRHFYSWKAILRRWGRFLASYARGEKRPLRFLFRSILTSVIFLRLALFQRDHARRRVYPLMGTTETKEPARLINSPVSLIDAGR
jgi:radical SAM superfamily enzyme YgiQ (UPF0313 family)